MTLATTVALPVIRGPAPLAKALAALDVLSDGRVLAGRRPRVVGARLRRSPASRSRSAGAASTRRFPRSGRCSTATSSSRGRSSAPGPPIWVASWGSPPGLRRVARHGDGWLASAYNITPERFRAAAGRGVVAGMPNALATAWLCVTEDAGGAERVLSEVLAPLVGRPVDELRSRALPIGPAEVCAERMRAFADAGAQRVFLWPLARRRAAARALHGARCAPRMTTGRR